MSVRSLLAVIAASLAVDSAPSAALTAQAQSPPSASADRPPPPAPLQITPSSSPLNLRDYLPDALQPLLVTPSAKPLDLNQFSPDETTAMQNGAYGGLPQQLHTAPRSAPAEQPSIKPMANMYQLDLIYADLFSLTGRSMICGAAAMANAIKFLRVSRLPPMVDLAKTSVSSSASDQEWMRAAFARCGVSRTEGSTDRELLSCARSFLKEGGYAKAEAALSSVWADRGSGRQVAPQLVDLSAVIQQNRAAVLLFGWYTATRNPLNHGWTYTRTGGHFVTLAGYDQARGARIYISNPLIDYAALGVEPVSALVLEPVGADIAFAKLGGASSQNLNRVAGQKWQTRDLTARRIAVLESILATGPTTPIRNVGA
jgi:hypothetical protein